MIRSRVVALTSLYLLVVCATGMLHPVRNALVLGALGGSDFYRVYLASALVAVAVVPFGRLAARVPQQRLTPAVAIFFAINLVIFRALFPGGAVFGVLFYAWHDLFAGILVSQFFLAAEAMLDPRSAKSTYPRIIAAGSVGAAIGGAATGFLAPSIGVANLMLIAAGLTVTFAFALPVVTKGTAPARQSPVREREDANRASVREAFSNRQVQLIAATVVITVLVKQLVDYQFNVATATLGDSDAISAYQGKFNAATQWLPLVAAAAIRPALAQWGVGAALLMLPASMIVVNILVGLRGGLGPAAVAKGTETALRYSAERTGREILYMPVPDDIRARAKPLIDVGLESGLAKALSAALIFVLLATVGPSRLAWVCVALAVVWLCAAVAERRAYVRSLADALSTPRGLPELALSLEDPTARGVVRHALAAGDPAQVGFVLDMLAYAAPSSSESLKSELAALRSHPDATVRARAAALTSAGMLANRELPPVEPPRKRGPAAAAALLGAAADDTLELALRTDALRALRRLHDDDPNTRVERRIVDDVVSEHLDAAGRYAAAGAVLHDDHKIAEADRLLHRAIREAWQTRQGAVFNGLGVLYEPRIVEGCYRAITGSDERRRAEAMELIEESASRRDVQRIEPILRSAPDYESMTAPATTVRDVVATLKTDDDAWVAQCAAYLGNSGRGDETMQVIERVFLLQRVDVFTDMPSHHLARIALLAREVEADAGAVLLHAADVADAMYVVADGELRAEHDDMSRTIEEGEGIGALALLDDEPIGVDVRAVRRTRLLRLTRHDLADLLHDHPELAVSLLRGVAARLRVLVEPQAVLATTNSRSARL